ncbi:MAG: protein kinase [Planctomycetales bacterium]|nr:protein kinase [Planctomycetales bacterium]
MVEVRTLDNLIDQFEDAVSEHGIERCCPAAYFSQWYPDNDDGSIVDAPEALVELLRVWMEHRFIAGISTTLDQVTEIFPQFRFGESQLELLQFELQRLRSAYTEEHLSGQPILGNRDLPKCDSIWQGFELLELLGTGAFANVYLARQVEMAGRLVALKLSYRKTDESQLLAKLHHSAIVPVYSLHESHGIYGVCMPYLGNTTIIDLLRELGIYRNQKTTNFQSASGHELLEILSERNRFLSTVVELAAADHDTVDHHLDAGESPSQTSQVVQPANLVRRASTARQLAELSYVEAVTWIGAQLADGLAHAHRMGILHCDIKPANILLGADGQARLLDFNVALSKELVLCGPEYFRQTPQRPQRIGGTLPYMSPEQLLAIETGEAALIDARSDVFSLGVVLYEMLTGEVPQEANNKTSEDFNELLRKKNPSASPALRAIVVRCLAEDREQRYLSADELYDDLHAQATLQPLVHISEPSAKERVHKWIRRHPAATSITTVASLASMLLAAVTGLLVWRGIRLNELESRQRIQQLQSSLPEAISLASVVKEYPELADEARHSATQALTLLVSSEQGLQDFRPQGTILAKLARQNLLPDSSAKLEQPGEENGSRNAFDELESSLSEWTRRTQEIANEDFGSFEEAYFGSDFQRAIQIASDWIPAEQNNYAHMLMLGISYLKVGNYLEASECFSICTSLRPELPIGWFYRGISRLKLKRGADAKRDFVHCLELQPELNPARFNLALALEMQGNGEEAIEVLSRGLDSGWQSVAGLTMRARLRDRVGNSVGANEDRRNALLIQATSERDHLEQGLLLLAEDPEKAQQSFEAALKLNSDSIFALKNLAHLCSERLAIPGRALEYLQQLIRIEPKNPEHWAASGVVSARQGELEKALQHLTRASELKPAQPLVAFQIACGYSLAGETIINEGGKTSNASVPSLDKLRSVSQQWYQYAVRLDASIEKMALTDPDIQWLLNDQASTVANQISSSQ